MLRKLVRKPYLIAASAAVIFFSSAASQQENRKAMTSEHIQRDDERETQAVIDRFNQVFNQHDANALAVLLTDDTVFEDTSPPPDGRRIEGKTAVVAFWREWFAHNPDAQFQSEEMIVSGDRAIVRWVYRKMRNGQPWRLRGVDVFTVRAGKVAAKLAYVKGGAGKKSSRARQPPKLPHKSDRSVGIPSKPAQRPFCFDQYRRCRTESVIA